MLCRYESPMGTLWIAEENGLIVRITEKEICGEEGMCPVLERTVFELSEYFAGKRKEFTVPIAPRGTSFRMKVWDALRRIPYGETKSYGEIAAVIGQPKAARAVGGANNKNPILILIPCHRVIGANGGLVGFGAGLPMKEALLRLESLHTTDDPRNGQ